MQLPRARRTTLLLWMLLVPDLQPEKQRGHSSLDVKPGNILNAQTRPLRCPAISFKMLSSELLRPPATMHRQCIHQYIMQQLDREVAQDTSPQACCVCNSFGCKLKLMQHILWLPHCSPHLRHCIPGQPMSWLASAVNNDRDSDINAMLETVSAQTSHAPLITDTSHYGQDVP